MTQRTLRQNTPWKLRGAVAALVALAGGLTALGSLIAFDRLITSHLSPEAFVMLACLGASGAGLIFGPYIGRAGWRGGALSVLAFFAATVLGAYFAGALGLRAHRMDLVATWLVFNFATPLGFMWLVLWSLLHWGSRALRRRFI